MVATLYNPETLAEFYQILSHNDNLVIFKFGADWCAPCKKIDPLVEKWFAFLSENTNIQTVFVDVDASFELYAFLKTKKMIQGIPTLLAYKKDNTSYTFDDSVVGADFSHVEEFFQRCLTAANYKNVILR